MVTKTDLLQALKEVRENPDPLAAICTNIHEKLNKLPQYQRDISRELDDILRSLFTEWPKYSGYPRHPVPSVTPDLTAPEQFNRVALSWASFWEGEYGELRKELLQFCIDTLTKELKNEEPAS